MNPLGMLLSDMAAAKQARDRFKKEHPVKYFFKETLPTLLFWGLVITWILVLPIWGVYSAAIAIF